VFHVNTTAMPAEITSHIIKDAMADTRPLPMGGGISMRGAHHAVASVSHALRQSIPSCREAQNNSINPP
jgi:hypothetical protein